MKKKISITMNRKTLKEIDNIIDKIYIRNRSQAIELLVNKALGENKNAVLLSGGPEDLLAINSEFRITAKIKDSYLIEHAINKLREDGFKNIYIVGRHKIITKVFNIVQNGSKYGVELTYIEEQESQGTADSLRLLRGRINSTFLVIYGDILFNRINIEELWNTHIKKTGIATLMLTTTPNPNKKGVVKIEGSKILEFEQKPKGSDIYLGFSSIFIAQPELLEYSGKSLEKDIFPVLAKKGMLNGHLSANKEKHIHTKQDIMEAENLV
ncbi:hypothetical protein GF327_08795 [Candidatus Woesearchaeota archaeon]|nr:hypothetical protein [Candidatus Woesearchaeota archaeon]